MAINVTHSKVSTIPDGDDTSLIRPSDWNDDHVIDGLGTMAEQNANAVAITGGTISGVTLPASNITGTLDVPHGGTGATTLTGYVKGAGTTALTASSTIPNTDITGLGTASTKDAGVALGVATLDAGGTVPLSQIPASIVGGLNYQGTWNASTNTPTLTSSVGTKGYYYAVSVSGTTNLNGITDWTVGDLAVFDGSAWQQIDNTDAVTSVNGYTGTVVLGYADVGAFPATATTGTGNVVLATNPTISNPNIDVVDFDTTYATTLTAGQLGWDGNNTLALGMAGGNVIQHIGEDSFFYIKASSAITKGQLVMFTGAVGASGVLTGAPSTGVTNPQYIMGVAAESIALNGFGLIQWFGEITGINTNGFNEGDVLYYDSAVTGGLTNVFPTSGIIVTVAAVAKKSAGGGVLVIRVTSTDRITASTGISVSQNGTGTTVTNTAPDQTVSIASGTGISATGTYPAFTVTNTGVTSAVAGTGISVSGSTGAVTVTNTAPDQTVSLTAGTGISTSGTYPNFTITNTAPSSGGTVTSVGGTGTVNGISLSGTVTSSGNLTLGGTLSGVSLSTQVTGNLPVTNLNSGTGASSSTYWRGDGTWATVSGGSGTVTSVAATVPSFLSVSGSPITTSGTLALSYSGTALPVANGGTGITSTPTNGQIPIGNGTNYTAATLTAGTGISITNASGSITIGNSLAPYSASYLIVAGGAGASGGGGGAGGLLSGTTTLVVGTTYTATVGGGGAGGNASTIGGNGSNSSFTGLTTTIGGGGGGFFSSGTTNNGASGGSGGGGGGADSGQTAGVGGSGTSGQGYGGGNGVALNTTQGRGGGGGAGAVGANASGSTGGAGGIGVASSITGSSTYYAGGGGGGSGNATNAAGGNGGGGAGGIAGTNGSAGTANLGGGGGGSGSVSPATGGNGGSGVIIISVPTASYSGITTGSPTVTTSGSNTIIKFTSSGSYTG